MNILFSLILFLLFIGISISKKKRLQLNQLFTKPKTKTIKNELFSYDTLTIFHNEI